VKHLQPDGYLDSGARTKSPLIKVVSEIFRRLSNVTGAHLVPLLIIQHRMVWWKGSTDNYLKVAIMIHGSRDRVERLSLVLLRIRTTWKEDLAASTAELVNGEPLRLPGDFV
jgi:hypothetical protein